MTTREYDGKVVPASGSDPAGVVIVKVCCVQLICDVVIVQRDVAVPSAGALASTVVTGESVPPSTITFEPSDDRGASVPLTFPSALEAAPSPDPTAPVSGNVVVPPSCPAPLSLAVVDAVERQALVPAETSESSDAANSALFGCLMVSVT
jgi:hypothetical protein